ncbi:MAG: hypothetical protein ACYC0H_09670, partial [Solirubrobacteraceae bacterium]
GLATTATGNSNPPRRLYSLHASGRDLLEAIAALESWTASWKPADADGGALRRLVAHPHARLIGRALVEGALPFRECQRRIHGLSAGTLQRLLASLQEIGVVRVDPRSPAGHPLYELDEPARRFGRVIVLAARWRWRWAGDRASPDAGDLPGLVHLLAPVAKAQKSLEGVCQLELQPAPHWERREPLITWVRVAEGRLAALALPPIIDVDARVSGPPLAWCDGLLTGAFEGIDIAGDPSIATGVLGALAGAIVGPAHCDSGRGD